MLFPFAIFAAGVLTPLLATTVLSLGLVAREAMLAHARTPAAKPVRRVDKLRNHPRETSILHDLSLDLSRLHDELKLDASQDRLWYKAEKAGWGDMSNVQTCLQEQRTETLALLAQPGADMRAIVRCLDDFRSEEYKLCAANRERWLNVYDALGTEQKEQVRVFFRNRMELANPLDVTQSLRTSGEPL